jgi:hypothetical protein
MPSFQLILPGYFDLTARGRPAVAGQLVLRANKRALN